MVAPAAATLLAILCGFLAMKFAEGRLAQYLVPAGGLLLAAVTVFGLLPELSAELGWTTALALIVVGFAALALLDKLGVAVCPSCQHGEGFAGSLVAAVGVHAFIDGWALVATGSASGPAVSHALASAMMLHKIPEGLALGTLLRASTPRFSIAGALLVGAEGSTLLGGWCGLWAPPGTWMSYLLALASGTFLFLGLHALDWRRKPARENKV